MGSQGGGSTHDLIVESWIEYSIGIVLFLVRLYARYKRLKFHYQIEDYLMVIAVLWYTAFVVTNIKIAQVGGSSLYEPGQYESFSADEIKQRVLGSKIEFASENCNLCAVYCLKACMLLVYFRMTTNLKQHLAVQCCAVYTSIGWLASVLTLFLNCHPLTAYWVLPPPQRECATYFRYEVVQCVFNISSDLAILAVILPLLFRTRMPWRNKLPLLVVFSMGILVIICAIISKYFTFHNIYDSSYQFWYLRESSIGLWVTNAPYVWSLIRSTFSILRGTSATRATPTSNFRSTKPGTNTQSSHMATRASRYNTEGMGGSQDNIFEMAGQSGSPHSGDESSGLQRWTSEIEESHPRTHDPKIWKTTEIVVHQT
ncbi:hypothetical protein N7495_007495 [Penicillium taxi]|uniref:uncharacterized protein n=1 Tax=Penicillium taxi TaxID=168475 RepID=UPI00254538C8|nr:uncharacterized protein N7495_007495 [Penicillium taxi]KAJ5887454.1 hypothetical protein N7495_007495 [Penicillium taxi]